MGAIFGNAILSAISLAIGLFANLFVSITAVFLGITVTIFKWVTSPGFISLSYTDPAGNPFIAMGWNFTRGLTNIVFVVALIAIGVGTTLRIREYQVQKLLLPLITIALLVNFSPVILGIIVDASNIVMNFFMQGGLQSGNVFANLALQQVDLIKGLAGGVKFWDPTATGEALAAAAASVMMIFFNIIAMVIYSLYSLLFILRYVAIWILTILSPLAFASYILPKTRGVFNQWWKLFIQWSIIGVIMGFFLYLSENLTYLVTQPGGLLNSPLTDPSQAPGFSIIFNNILPYFIPLILMMVGLTVGLAGAPQGAQGIIRIAQKAPAQITKAGGKFTTSVARGIPAIQRIEEKIKRRIETTPLISKITGGPGAYTRELAKKKEAAKSKVEHLQPQELEKIIKTTPLTHEDRLKRAAVVETLAEKGWLKAEHERYIPEAIRLGVPEKTIDRVAPHLIPQTPEGNKKFADVISRLRADDIDKLTDEAKESERVIRAIISTGRADYINKLGSQNKRIQDTVQKQIDNDFGEKWVSGGQFSMPELELLRNFHTNPASQGLGWKMIGTLQEIEERIKNFGKPPKPPEGKPSGLVTPGSPEFEKTEREKRLPK